jgi:hypothetical protein
LKPNGTNVPQSRYLKVLDGRGHAIRGLSKTRKTGAFYVHGGRQARRPLSLAAIRAQAVDKLHKLKTKGKKGKLVVVKDAPKLFDALESFKADARFFEKRPDILHSSLSRDVAAK